jgi:hypothetical protein
MMVTMVVLVVEYDERMACDKQQSCERVYTPYSSALETVLYV